MKNIWKDEMYQIWMSVSEITEIQVKIENLVESLLAEQKKELMEEERRFILNVLDGIDIADKQMGVVGGTQAIRQALQSRVI